MLELFTVNTALGNTVFLELFTENVLLRTVHRKSPLTESDGSRIAVLLELFTNNAAHGNAVLLKLFMENYAKETLSCTNCSRKTPLRKRGLAVVRGIYQIVIELFIARTVRRKSALTRGGVAKTILG